MGRVEIRQLQCFVTLAEELSFARAASRLYMSQPPLTRQIRRLEETIGVPLFVRTTRRVELTSAGIAYLPEVRAALCQLEKGIRVAQRGARVEAGELAIGVEASCISDATSKAIGTFRRRHPLVSLVVHALRSEDRAEALRKGTIELGFIVAPVRDESIACETMFSVPLVAVLPQSHPLSACRSVRLEDLANEDFVLGPGDHRCGLLENIIAVCRRAGFTPRVAQEAHEMQLMLAFIAEGVGVALLPKYVMKLRKPGVVCRPLTDTSAHTDITVAWQRHSTSPAVSSFLRIIREASAAYALSNGARSSVRRPVEALSSIGQACASRAA